MKGYVERFKKEQMLSPEVQSTLAEAKSNLSPADFSKFAELLEKAKGGVQLLRVHLEQFVTSL